MAPETAIPLAAIRTFENPSAFRNYGSQSHRWSRHMNDTSSSALHSHDWIRKRIARIPRGSRSRLRPTPLHDAPNLTKALWRPAHLRQARRPHRRCLRLNRVSPPLLRFHNV